MPTPPKPACGSGCQQLASPHTSTSCSAVKHALRVEGPTALGTAGNAATATTVNSALRVLGMSRLNALEVRHRTELATNERGEACFLATRFLNGGAAHSSACGKACASALGGGRSTSASRTPGPRRRMLAPGLPPPAHPTAGNYTATMTAPGVTVWGLAGITLTNPSSTVDAALGHPRTDIQPGRIVLNRDWNGGTDYKRCIMGIDGPEVNPGAVPCFTDNSG